MDRRTRSRVDNGGFTLVEVIVALCILGLSASIVAVNLRGPLRRERVNSAIQQCIAVEQFARLRSKKQELLLVAERSTSGAKLTVQDINGKNMYSRSFPRSIAIELYDLAAQELTHVKYTQVAGTRDFVVRIQDGSLQESLFVAGATGHTLQMRN